VVWTEFIKIKVRRERQNNRITNEVIKDRIQTKIITTKIRILVLKTKVEYVDPRGIWDAEASRGKTNG
jgi:hypothetical protein